MSDFIAETSPEPSPRPSRAASKANLLGLNSATGRANESIHPRVVGGRTAFAKVNTAARENTPPGKKLRKARRALEIRRQDYDVGTGTSETLRRARKKPGSMRLS